MRLYAATTRPEPRDLTETQYFAPLRDIYNVRNPHAQVGLEGLKAEGEDSP